MTKQVTARHRQADVRTCMAIRSARGTRKCCRSVTLHDRFDMSLCTIESVKSEDVGRGRECMHELKRGQVFAYVSQARVSVLGSLYAVHLLTDVSE